MTIRKLLTAGLLVLASFTAAFTAGTITAGPASASVAASVTHAYQLSGHPVLGHGSEVVSVVLAGDVHDVTVQAEPESGDYVVSARARYDAHSGRWVAVFRFGAGDETGTWYVAAAEGRTPHGSEERTGPDPAFTVGGAESYAAWVAQTSGT
jgi:hypothetical protein